MSFWYTIDVVYKSRGCRRQGLLYIIGALQPIQYNSMTSICLVQSALAQKRAREVSVHANVQGSWDNYSAAEGVSWVWGVPCLEKLPEWPSVLRWKYLLLPLAFLFESFELYSRGVILLSSFVALLGRNALPCGLAPLLLLKGWTPSWPAQGHCRRIKEGELAEQLISISTYVVIPERLCMTAYSAPKVRIERQGLTQTNFAGHNESSLMAT